jgi:hypothetical protein
VTQPDQQLTEAVRELTSATVSLRRLLADEYPRRSEVERRFVSKLAQQRYFSRMVVLALFVVISCYAISVGSYSVCFVGDLDNPGVCKLVPGYKERVERNKQVNLIHQGQDDRISRLERRAGLKPIGDD